MIPFALCMLSSVYVSNSAEPNSSLRTVSICGGGNARQRRRWGGGIAFRPNNDVYKLPCSALAAPGGGLSISPGINTSINIPTGRGDSEVLGRYCSNVKYWGDIVAMCGDSEVLGRYCSNISRYLALCGMVKYCGDIVAKSGNSGRYCSTVCATLG